MFEAKLIDHRGMKRIGVYFEYNPDKIIEIKSLRGATWSYSKKCWHLPDTREYRERFNLPLYDADYLSEEAVHKISQFELYLKSKRYSPSTVKTYMEVVRVFLHFYIDKPLFQINNDDVIAFNNAYILKKKLSQSYQNQFVNGVKLFFQIVENKEMVVSLIQRPRVERKLPRVLSKKEVKDILEAPTNIKHRTMLSLIYACGLRSGELLNLKPNDILSERNLLHVYQSKGKKDRIIPISEKVIEMLRSYYKAYRPLIWLFEGQVAGKPYSSRSLQMVLKNALLKANVKKPATLHWLRHSYATHLLENGTDIRYIQELLGHNSSRTTEIYTHVSNRDIQKIKSPFDDL